jgi:hypothetical protein
MAFYDKPVKWPWEVIILLAGYGLLMIWWAVIA